MTKEFLVTSNNSKGALGKLRFEVAKYLVKYDWVFVKYLVRPESLKYSGKNKKFRGKWRGYTRIKVA